MALTTETLQLQKVQQASLTALIDLAETRDPDNTGKHLQRMQKYATILLRKMPLEQKHKEHIVSTIGFHDIGLYP